MSGSIPSRISSGYRGKDEAGERFAEGKVDAFLATTPSAGAARPENRPYDRQHDHRQAMVAAFLLHDFRHRGLCEQVPGGDQACVAGHIQVRRPLRVGSANGGAAAGRTRFRPSYDYALQTLNDIRYDRWRDYDPEDALRFFALRMQETGMIKSSPQKIIADGTDWRFLKELKRELKT